MTTRTRDTQPSEAQEVIDLAPVDLATSAQRLTRFDEIVRTMRSLPQAARTDLAAELNELLIAMRAPGHEAEESERILELLASKTLEGLVDPIGRSCRNEAVETMLSSGFPHALALDAADVAFARAWRAGHGTEQPLADWELVLLRNRRRGAVAIGLGQALSLLFMTRTELFSRWPVQLTALSLLTIVSAVAFGLVRPRTMNVGLIGSALFFLVLAQFLVFITTPISAGSGLSIFSMFFGLIVGLNALDRPTPRVPGEPNFGPPRSQWLPELFRPRRDPWGRSEYDWNYGREPTLGEKVPNPKGDFWDLRERKTP